MLFVRPSMSGCSGKMTARPGNQLTAREYIEAVARELGKVRGSGLLLSPADASLALSWHADQVPLAAVLAEVRRAAKLRAKARARGAAEPPISLRHIAGAIDGKAPVRPTAGRWAPPRSLCDQLLAAARAEGLAARQAWEDLAQTAEELLALQGGDGYWTAAVRALKASLRELPRKAVLQAGAALRARIVPRPPGMARRPYQRSLQLMLLDVASDRLGVPPRAFLL